MLQTASCLSSLLSHHNIPFVSEEGVGEVSYVLGAGSILVMQIFGGF